MTADRTDAKWELPDDDTYAQLLVLSDLWREPSVREAIGELNLPAGSRGLDAGCGIGQHSLWLADAVGSAGHVTGLDLSADFVSRAAATADKAGVSDRISYQQGDINQLPFEDDTFDWLWSADTVYFGPSAEGYVAEDPAPLLGELARVVKPGGRIHLAYCSAQNLLPGYPALEARLNTISAETEPFVRQGRPGLHCLRALEWLRTAGLEVLAACSKASCVQAPLDNELREALAGLLRWRWGSDPLSKLSEADAVEYQRLCKPDSPDFILDLSDYYTFITCSVFSGRIGP